MSLVANLLQSPTVQEFLKSANISQSYERISSGTFLRPMLYVVFCFTVNKHIMLMLHTSLLCTDVKASDTHFDDSMAVVELSLFY